MKKIKDFIYNNKKNILLFILATLGMICLANCNIPKAKAQTGITELNDLWGKSWQLNEDIDILSVNASLYLRLNKSYSSNIGEFGEYEIRPDQNRIVSELYYWTGETKLSLVIYNENSTQITNYTKYLRIYDEQNSWLVNERIITFYEQPEGINFTSNSDTMTTNLINWWNDNVVEIIPPQTNNLNIYVNDTLAYNDIIEFNNTGNPGIQFIYSNYTTNQFDFINNLAKPLKYTANEFIANVFNVSNDTTTASSIDFAFNGSYLVGVSYDYINTAGSRVSNSYELTPDDDDSIRFLMFTDLQRNDTDINVRITTNNLNDFESGAVNSAFKTLFGFFNEIINIQFGFITIGQILGFILAIAIIGLIYKVWNGGNND